MKKMCFRQYIFYSLFFLFICIGQKGFSQPESFSGIYPHLAHYNNEGECGTGAVVPWADKLWVITYGPHKPFGSSDKLYEITSDLKQITRDESIGGTPANRMIHKESKQLFIGPYVIDEKGNVRTISCSQMPGRLTGNARDLKDPVHKIYYATMEQGFYEVNVNTLDVKTFYEDGNLSRKEGKKGKYDSLLPGAHGKGLYSGQGVLVYANNGELSNEAQINFKTTSGVLAEWDGKDWKVIRRNQFTDVTGPGGIYGNPHPKTDPIWTIGWDFKSLILGVRNFKTGWNFFRLPKASNSYDGATGWNTEWPRIRNIGTSEKPDYLMTMHGMFWRFPGSFTADNSKGIRPRSSYLKVIGDFSRWKDRLVFGCDDSAKDEFLNKRKQKGNIKGAGQSNSNLWFTSLDKPDHLGPVTSSGAVWVNDDVKGGEYSEPFLFSGWSKRCVWIQNNGENSVKFSFEVDKNGTGNFIGFKTVNVTSGSSQFLEFNEEDKGEWIRVSANKKTNATVTFNYSDADKRDAKPSAIFKGLADVKKNKVVGGFLYSLGDNRRVLGVSAMKFENGIDSENGYYELDEKFNLVKKDDPETNSFIQKNFTIPKNVIQIENSSVLVVDDKGRRWRLPLGNEKYKLLTDAAKLRICREVSTERDLFNASGTFYELPAENADGFAKLRPISSHNFRIHDYASYRGLLVMTGMDIKAKSDEHIVRSDDGYAAIWLGVIDDLWKLGKPVGFGGPWKDSEIKAGSPSDPYLIGFYDKRLLRISHNSKKSITFKIEVDPIGDGQWMLYKKVTVQPGKSFKYKFPDGFEARWVRFVSDKDCKATTWLEYN